MTTPLRNPEEYQFDLNLPGIAEVWRRGRAVARGQRPGSRSQAGASGQCLFRHAERVWIKDAGHWLIDEKPDEIGAHLKTFLSQTRSNRSGGPGSSNTESNATDTLTPNEVLTTEKRTPS